MRRAFVLLLVVSTFGLAVAACGGDEEAASPTTTAETTTTEETTTQETTTDAIAPAGREVFVANCGSCHTLSDAGTSGAIGPELDGGGYDADQVEVQVRNGGGTMPAFEDTLSDEEIEEVSAYVAAASSG